ncbi:MAG: hypothetical protein MUC49_04830 [Raineya sp.]|nr:hypothetical protein [Raineya sp.]
MKKILLFGFFLSLMGCLKSNKVIYKAFDTSFDTCQEQKIVCFAKIPKPYKLEKFEDQHSHLSFTFHFPDSTILYISNDILSGHRLNAQNIKNEGKIYRIPYKDTLYLSGKQPHYLYWAEIAYPKVIIGYLNAPENRKTFYDNFLKNLHCECIFKR